MLGVEESRSWVSRRSRMMLCCGVSLLPSFVSLTGNLLEGVCHERVHCLASATALVSYNKVEARACAATSERCFLLK